MLIGFLVSWFLCFLVDYKGINSVLISFRVNQFRARNWLIPDFHWRLVPKRINATQRRLLLGLLASRLWFFMDRHSFARSNLPLDPAPGQHGQQDRQRRRGAKKLWHPATENCVFRLSFCTWNVCSMFNVPFKFELLQQTFQQYKVALTRFLSWHLYRAILVGSYELL